MLQSCRAAWGARPHAPRATAPSRLQGNAAAAAAASKSPGASRGGSRASAAAAASASAGAGSAPAAVGVVIVDHGSRKRDSNDMLVRGDWRRRSMDASMLHQHDHLSPSSPPHAAPQQVEFGELYRRQTGARIVEVAHMEIAEPTIEQAIGACGGAAMVRAAHVLLRNATGAVLEGARRAGAHVCACLGGEAWCTCGCGALGQEPGAGGLGCVHAA